MSRSDSKFLLLTFTALLAITAVLIPAFVKADPPDNYERSDVICAATLPCRPPAFEVEEGFNTGACAEVYKKACDRWKDTKAKADALDVAAAKLLQCMQEKKKKSVKSK